MKVSTSMLIPAPKEKIWSIVTDIEHAAQRMDCIKNIEILNQPQSGLIGLKWKETRTMFGKEAVETMWITEAKENQYYITEAKNSGCIYHSTVSMEDKGDRTLLSMSFQSSPQTLAAKIMSPMMFLMKGMIKKAFNEDLENIKTYAITKN